MSQPIEGYPLSAQQRRLWSLDRTPAAWRARAVIRLEGALDRDRLRDAWARITARHEILRTAFVKTPGLAPLQVITEPYRPELQFADLSNLAPDAQVEAMDAAGQTPALDRGQPLVLRLWQLGPGSHALTVELPALCADVTTLHNLFADELRAAYAGPMAPDDDPVQYADYAAFQDELLESGDPYWDPDELRALPRAIVPFLTPGEGAAASLPRLRPVDVPEAAYRGLLAQARRCGIELDSVLFGCWQLLLQRLTGLYRFAIGAVLDGRQQPGTGRALGLFARAVPLRCQLDPDLTIGRWLGELAATWQEHAEHHEAFVAPPRRSDTAEDPDDWVIGFEYTECPGPYEVEGVRVSLSEVQAWVDRFAISLRCVRHEDGLRVALVYDSDRIDDSTIERMAAQLATVLTSLVALDPDRTLRAVDVVPPAERELVSMGFNATTIELPLERCIHHHIAAQAERAPDAVAVIADDGSFTYRALDQRSNQWAHVLRQRGIAAEAPVALMMKPSLELVAAILGTLKAGGCYMPLDLAHPGERMRSMLETAGAAIAIADSDLAERLPETDVPTMSWQHELDALDQASRERLPDSIPSSALAYIMHTSGSTGEPKGVMVEHRGVCNHMLWVSREIPLSPGDRVLQKAPLGFDASAFELFWPLFRGATVVLARQDGYRDLAYLGQLIGEHRVSHIIAVPHLLRALVAAGGLDRADALQCAIAAGEVLTAELLDRFKARLPDVELYNFYGPTEASIDATCYRCPRSVPHSAVPIGRPFANTQVYILDPERRPVPIGVAGEIYLAGVGLARGYAGLPDETSERFVANPFDAGGEGRMYRTGDVGRWLPEGVIEFLGRVDDQVKIRGYRIELAEVEKALDEHEGVEKSLVVARGDQSARQLVAYVIPSQHRRTLVQDIREAMHQKLPDYMIPSQFVVLDEFPLTANGKIDTNQLPEPDRAADRRVVPPRSDLERVLLEVFRQVLQRNDVGVTHNFFALGGDSLLIIQACGEIKQRTGQEVEVRAFFVAPTVEQLAEVLQRGQPRA
jgi:amino acid adenylation domain-containing protein